MPVALEAGSNEEVKDGKVYERSQQDGELYSKPTIGIIYPPPEVRNIVDRTANFVARNGPEFEDRIRANEADNIKFNFLNPNDPYHAYYENKLKEFRESDLSEPPPASLLDNSSSGSKEPQKQQLKQKPVNQVIEAIVPKDPPPAFEYMTDPPTISAIDLDVVKLTAQFVAKNGKGFLTNLMTREQRNYQFDFLRPQHSLFQYFTRLVEQYTKILLPPSDISTKLRKDVDDSWAILDAVKYRVEWQRFQEREKRKVEDEKERARIAFSQIDWHDFVVVETVNFREEESANLPPPVQKEQLGARLLQQERMEKREKNGETEEMDVEEDDDDDEEVDFQTAKGGEKDEEEGEGGEEELYNPQDEEKGGSDMEEESDEEDEEEEEGEKEDRKGKGKRPRGSTKPLHQPLPPPMPPPPVPAVPSNANVRKYDPKAAKTKEQSALPSDKYLISPLTGEKVPAKSMDQHMKISLLDPRWKEQKEKAIEEKRQQDQVFAEGGNIGDTLKQLAERRSDIFGVGAEETYIGQKLGEDDDLRKPAAEIWDGHTSSMERATKLAHSNITYEDQIRAIHQAKGLIPSADAQKIGPAVPGGSEEQPGPSGGAAPLTIEEILGGAIVPVQPPIPEPKPQPPKLPQMPPLPDMPPKPLMPPNEPMSSKMIPPPIPPMPPSMPTSAPSDPPRSSTLSRPQPPPIPSSSSSRSSAAPPSLLSVKTDAPQSLMNKPMPPPPGSSMPPNVPMAGPPMVMPPGGPAMMGMARPPMMGMMMPPNMTRPPGASPFMAPSLPQAMSQVMDEPPILLPPPSEEPDEPMSKKAKMDSLEAELVGEAEFMKRNTKPVTFRVSVPELPDKPEWQCQGQTLTVTLPLSMQCNVIKTKIFEMINMPQGKQKLQLGNFFIKDSNSLAYYNFSATSIVQLQVKERGGRKK